MNNYDITLERIKSLKNVAFLEGPNEMDGPVDPYWADGVKAWYTRMHNDIKADPNLKDVPWVAPTVSYWNNWPLLSELGPMVDYGNVHPYPGGQRPMHHLQLAIDAQVPVGGNKPVIVTEVGYFSAPNIAYSNLNFGVSELAQAKYLTRAYFDYFNAGVAKTMGYELVDYYWGDQGYYHYGLLRTDFTYKPAANAIKNIISLLEDVGPEFEKKPVKLSISGGNAESRSSLLQKRDGEYWLALWQDAMSFDYNTRKDIVVPAVAQTITVDRPILSAKTYVPRLSADPTNITLTPLQRQLTLSVVDEVILLSMRLADYGDANLDGSVDYADFVILHDNFGAAGTWTSGDFSGDGRVSFADFQLLERNFDSEALSAAQAEVMAQFPEPGGLLAGIAAVVCLTRRRR
jgi:hypothetical protein